MTLQTSGDITLANIQTEFGGANPISLSEYYAGGGYVPAGTAGTYGAVPSSGAITLQNFYGTSNKFAPPISFNFTGVTNRYTLPAGWSVYFGRGELGGDYSSNNIDIAMYSDYYTHGGVHMEYKYALPAGHKGGTVTATATIVQNTGVAFSFPNSFQTGDVYLVWQMIVFTEDYVSGRLRLDDVTITFN